MEKINLTTEPVSVVVPVYNEVENLVPLIDEIRQAFNQDQQFEIVIVDDCSTDNTLSVLSELQPVIPQLTVVKHQQNAGQSTAIVSGVRAARGQWIITMDGDGQNNPADIPKLIAALNEYTGPAAIEDSLVVGHRVNRHDTWVRRMSSRIANKVRGKLLQDNCPDTGCSLKLFHRNTFLSLPHFNHCHRFMPALFKRIAGGTVINVPVDHRDRRHGVSKYGINNRLWVGISDMLGVMWLIRRPCQTEIEHE